MTEQRQLRIEHLLCFVSVPLGLYSFLCGKRHGIVYNGLPYAEDLNYWKTSRTSADTWIDRAIDQIEKLGGTVEQHAFGQEPETGRAAYMIQFRHAEDRFKIVWPVLPSQTGNDRAARVQAATMLYHDCKTRALAAHVFSVRAAFFSWLLLPDGQVASHAGTPELLAQLPTITRRRIED